MGGDFLKKSIRKSSIILATMVFLVSALLCFQPAVLADPDPSPGDYIVTEPSKHILSAVTPGGVRTEISSGPASLYPAWVAIDGAGNYIVTDWNLDKLVKITPGGVVTDIYSFVPGSSPNGVAVDSAGNYIVTERDADNLVKVTPGGVRTLIYTFANGTSPMGVAINSAGNYIVTEYDVDKLSMVTPGGVRTLIYAWNITTSPIGVAINSAGNYIVTEYVANKLSMVTPGGVRTLIYTWNITGNPTGVAVDNAGDYIVTEYFADKLVKITPGGVRTLIYTFANGTHPHDVAIVPAKPPEVTVTKTVSPTDVYVAGSGGVPEWFQITIEVTGFGVNASDAPTDINVVETTQDYIIDESSFSIAPTSTNENIDGTTTIEWDDIEDIAGVGDGVGPLTSSETFTVSFMARCNTAGNNLPVQIPSVLPLNYPEPAVVYKNAAGQDASVAIPQAYINVTALCLEPTIESCDAAGVKKDVFMLTDDVYAIGTGYQPLHNYSIYVVEDVTWVDGMAIPPRVPGTTPAVTADASGNIVVTLMWDDPLVQGKYDIVVDVDNDGLYYAEADALDDSDVEVTAGFFVIPELPLGTVLAASSMFVALGGYLRFKRVRLK
jgi:hypothetical protein